MSKDSSLTATDAYPCTPSDTAPNVGCGFYVGGAGDVAVVTQHDENFGGPPVIFHACPVGTLIPLHFVKVMATGTSATLITVLSS